MKKTIARLFIVFLLSILVLGCEPKGDTLVILKNAGISVRQRSEGDLIDAWGGFRVEWKQNGCEISYVNREGKDTTKRIAVGETFRIETDSIPVQVYEFYLCNEGDQLPEEWQEIKQRQDQIQSKQAEYGSISGYKQSRNVEDEKQMMQDAFDTAGINVKTGWKDIDSWYDFFLEATWSHGDCLMQITKATAEKNSDGTKLTLTDEEGNELVIFNAYWAEYDNEFYFGYIE